MKARLINHLRLTLKINSAGTALKILHEVRMKTGEARKADAILSTEKLHNQDSLVSALASAIEQAIAYEQYQKMTSSEKKLIRQSIAEKLYQESIKYQTSYSDYNVDSKYYHCDVAFGLQVNTDTHNNWNGYCDDPTVKFFSVSFPEQFLKVDLLRKNVIAAIPREYHAMLLNSVAFFLSRELAGRHGLFDISGLNKLIGEYVEQEVAEEKQGNKNPRPS